MSRKRVQIVLGCNILLSLIVAFLAIYRIFQPYALTLDLVTIAGVSLALALSTTGLLIASYIPEEERQT